MSDKNNPFNYPVNPNFGQGIYRRRIRLQQCAGYVAGDLEDCNHGFQVQVYHDGKQVTKVAGQARRQPFTTCDQAIEPLQALQGIALGLSSEELVKTMNPRANCTHWLDLALLAIQHASRKNEEIREYDMAITDEDDKPANITLKRNGDLVLQWQVEDWCILQPENLVGNTLYRGFAHWANAVFANDDDKEAAFVLQKGYFVSRARRFDTIIMAGESANAHASMYDACFTYSQPRRDVAVRTENTTVDFTHIPEQLLRFVEPSTSK